MIARLRRWRHAHITIPRWLLGAIYLSYALIGLAIVVGGSPTLEFIIGKLGATIWAWLLVVVALGAMVGSGGEKLEALERWSSLGVASLLTTYVASAITAAQLDHTHAFIRWGGAIIAMFMFLLPAVRAGALLTRTGTKG